MKRTIAMLLILCFVSGVFCGCEPVDYVGDYADLHTVAVRSALNTMGGWHSEVGAMETDRYGRTLFLFDSSGWFEPQLLLVIAQPTVGDKAYFYDGKNMTYASIPSEEYPGKLTKEVMWEYFSHEQIEELKEANDWGKKVDYSKCFSVPIVRRNVNNFSDRTLRRAVENSPEPFFYRGYLSSFLAQDADGKSLYLMASDRVNNEGKTYLFMLDEKGRLVSETGVMELKAKDWKDYRQKLYEFKVANDWNFYIPIEEAMKLNGIPV